MPQSLHYSLDAVYLTLADGTILDAESPGIGQGTELVVRVPLQVVVTPAARPGSGSLQTVPNRRRVLVVDDNKDAAESLADVLRMLGHEVDVAHDGQTARFSRSPSPHHAHV